MNKKGFTLIELIAIIVIMGLIMLMVFPSLSRLMASNDKKKYDEYYKLVGNAADKYSRDRNADLGGTKGSGCIDDVTLEDLEREGLVNSFEEDGVVCALPNKFDLSTYDIDISKDYVNIRIRNNHGKITVEHSIVCVDSTNKLIYSNLVEKTGTCDRYVQQNSNVLFNAINGKGTADGDVYYLTTNNYLIYSGATWRIVSYNTKNKTIKLVLNEPLTLLNFDSTSSDFPNSNVDIWLNETYRDYLRNYTKFLDNAYWDYTAVSTVNGKPNGTNTIQRYVGLLNTYEYSKNTSVNITDKTFLLNKSTTAAKTVWVAGQGAVSINSFYLVRPSIVLKQNVPYISGGTGSSTNPFRLVGEQTALQGNVLNSRYIGEYVKIGSSVFRIMDVNSNYTKLVLNGGVSGAVQYDSTNIEIYSVASTLGTKLNTTWYNTLPNDIKPHVLGETNENESAEYCTTAYTGTTKYLINCNNADIVTAKVGGLKIGDIYATKIAEGGYWTVSRGAAQLQVNVLTPSNGITSTSINSTSYARPVIALDKTTVITGGAGTVTNPYTIQ